MVRMATRLVHGRHAGTLPALRHLVAGEVAENTKKL